MQSASAFMYLSQCSAFNVHHQYQSSFPFCFVCDSRPTIIPPFFSLFGRYPLITITILHELTCARLGCATMPQAKLSGSLYTESAQLLGPFDSSPKIWILARATDREETWSMHVRHKYMFMALTHYGVDFRCPHFVASEHFNCIVP